MKLLLLFSLSLFSMIASSQNCSTYFPFEDGKSWETASYDKKGKLESTAVHTISNVSKIDTGTKVTVTIKMTDSKKKDEVEMSYDMICSGENVKVSMKMFMPAAQLEQMNAYENMEVKMDMEDMDFPNTLSVGQDLQDCSMTMEVSANGIKVMSSTTKIKDRKVLEKTTITTTAGAFECFKITQTTVISAGFMNREFKSVSYISEGTGVVKSESYDSKGNLESYSEISKLN